MKVCDRHRDVEAVDSVTFGIEAEVFDLCEPCRIELHKFLTTTERKVSLFRGRKKDSASAE